MQKLRMTVDGKHRSHRHPLQINDLIKVAQRILDLLKGKGQLK